jgi:hypothetical protein
MFFSATKFGEQIDAKYVLLFTQKKDHKIVLMWKTLIFSPKSAENRDLNIDP